MLSGNGTIDYSVDAHTLDAHKTSAARQESTTRNIHGSITKNFQRLLHRNVRKSPSFNWDYKLIADSGTNASLVCGRRLLTKLVPLCSKVREVDDTFLLDVKGKGCLRIRLDNETTMAVEWVLCVSASEFNLVLVDLITNSTFFDVLFGKNNCLLTDRYNPEFSQVLGYNHGGWYHLAGKCIVWDQGQTTKAAGSYYTV